MEGLNLPLSEEDLVAVTNALDEDHSNSIELKEFKHILKRVRSQQAKVRGSSLTINQGQ